MALRIRKKASNEPASRRHYTYAVTLSFETQYSFTEDEVEQGEEGGKNDVEPTYEALAIFENDIREHLQLMYPIYNLNARTDFDHLLGVDGDPAIGAPASAAWEATGIDSKGRLQYIYGPDSSSNGVIAGSQFRSRSKRGNAGNATVSFDKM